MHTLQGYYKVEFCNLLTKLDGTAEQFASMVSNLNLQLSKKLATITVKDSNDGGTFRFIQNLENDREWLLRVTMLQGDMEPSYSLRFSDMKIKKHDVTLGETITQTLVSSFGVMYNHTAAEHVIQLSFGTYKIED